MNSNQIIQGFWYGGRLSTMERLCIKSFLANGHEFHLYAYDEIIGIPLGTTLRDASKIAAPSDIFRFRCLANFTDWFRHILLFEKGGWWSDLDNICLKPFDMPEAHVGKCNPLKAPAGSAVLAWVIEESLKKDWKTMHGADIGPRLWEEADQRFPKFELNKYMPLFHIPGDALNVISPTPPDTYEHYSVHIHHGSWMGHRLNPDATFPETSLYEILKRRYL